MVLWLCFAVDIIYLERLVVMYIDYLLGYYEYLQSPSAHTPPECKLGFIGRECTG